MKKLRFKSVKAVTPKDLEWNIIPVKEYLFSYGGIDFKVHLKWSGTRDDKEIIKKLRKQIKENREFLDNLEKKNG